MRKTILIIDDSDDDVFLTKTVISRIRPDIATEIAMSGDDVLLFLRDCKTLPSLILLDLKMPRMNGIDLLQEMRAISRLRRIPMVVLTNSELESDRKACFEAGADDFLQKATNLDHFTKDIECVLERWLDASKKQL